MSLVFVSGMHRVLKIVVVLAVGSLLCLLSAAAIADIVRGDEPDLTAEWAMCIVAFGLATGYVVRRKLRTRPDHDPVQ